MKDTLQKISADMLRVYESRIAQNWDIGLFFMLTAGSRLKIFREIRNRMDIALQSGKQGEPDYAGAHLEAVVGDFGSGKSHLAYLLARDAKAGIPDCLLMNFQMTGDRKLPKVLQNLLQTAQLPHGINPFHKLRSKFNLANNANISIATNIVRECAGSLDARFADDFVAALRGLNVDVDGNLAPQTPLRAFVDQWIGRQDHRKAIDAFLGILRCMKGMEVSSRCVLLIDEFEALEVERPEDYRHFFQGLQDLHDDLGGRRQGLPSTFIALFATSTFLETAEAALPSLFSVGDRLRAKSEMQALEKSEFLALFDRYRSLCYLAGKTHHIADDEAALLSAEKAWQGLRIDQRRHMRTVHSTLRRLADPAA